jgi:cystathionine beta-lyase family protein involved in aluminum resistance
MEENEVLDIINKSEKNVREILSKIDEISLINQERVLNAFKNHRVSVRHFSGTTGYGYGDCGRDNLADIVADIFGTEKAIVSPYITCGSHALAIAILGMLRPNNTMLSITGKPYDTLDDVLFGKKNEDNGSLKDYNINYKQVELKDDGSINIDEVLNEIKQLKPTLIYIQRSRGYAWRKALSVDDIKDACSKIREVYKDGAIMVDNCYGEFIDTKEPTSVGADICVGSFIKNIGGGIAPSGAYIAGKTKFIDKISYRFTSPSLALEVGSYAYGYRDFYEGLFLAPHITAQAMKGCILFSECMRTLKYEVLPGPNELPRDIITSIKFNDKDLLIKFCQTIQTVSPVDSFVRPEPWDMPGYNDPVIMAAGTFVDGASIELSSDAPIRPPYILYVQGGLTFEHVKIAIKECLKTL